MDEIIEMAKQAGFPFNKYGLLKGDDEGEIEADTMFETFAKLVEDAAFTRWAAQTKLAVQNEREACARDAEWCMQNYLEQHIPERIRARK